MLTGITIILAVLTMLILAIVMGYVLGWANNAFHVAVDPKIDKINNALPAANCGGCGYIGCLDYAEAVVLNKESVTKCTVGGASCADELATIMGIVHEEKTPEYAVIHCISDCENRLRIREYRGEQTCRAASFISGVQGCAYGCLGLGDCVKACEFDAIKIINNLAYIDYEKCVGCGACVKACPKNIIKMVPFKTNKIAVVACSNKDGAKEVREFCKIGCIGCKACTRVNPDYKMDGSLASLDYDTYKKDSDFKVAIDKCPRKCIIPIGKK